MYNISCEIKFREEVRAGKIVYGTMIAEINMPNIVKVLEASGLDFYIIDCEHGAFSYESVANIVAATGFSSMIPLARIPEIRKEPIQRMLDAGIGGIMVPGIKTVAEAESAVYFAKYKPEGGRGYNTFKPFSNYSTEHPAKILANANKGTFIILQIETREAIECIDELAAVKGVDAFLIGPGDLSLSYGLTGETGNPVIVSAIEKVIEAAKRKNLASGIHCAKIEDILFWRNKGMNLLMWSSPVMMVYNSCKAALDIFKGKD